MAALLLDVSRWQNPALDLSRVKDAGYSAVNIQLTGKQGFVAGDWARRYADQARALGLGVCCYHWLDGWSSANHQFSVAWSMIQSIGGPDGLAHQVDCEDGTNPALWATWRSYVDRMQQQLGRPVINYTGDWWWAPRKWPGAEHTPYLWAAPNAGYLGQYPGNASEHWWAGYGGWDHLSIMQYAVAPVADVKCSLSAIRDWRVWPALTGGERLMVPASDGTLRPQDEVAPEHDEGDLEQYAGKVIKDPWKDPAQTDWPDNPGPEAS